MNDKCFIALKQKNGPDFKMVSFCSNLLNQLTQISNESFQFEPEKVGNENFISTNVYNRIEEFDFKEILLVEIFGTEVNSVMFTPETGVFKEVIEGKQKTFEFDLLKMGIGQKVEANFKTSDTFSINKNF